MPNHVHLILVPSREDGLGAALAPAHRRYSWEVNQREGWCGHLWQSRFASFPLDEAHLYACLRYVELNPVRARLVDRPEDWRWSSAAETFAGLYVEHSPTYRVMVRFTGDAAATLARYTQNPLFVAQAAAVPVQELLRTQASVYDLLKGLGVESVSRVRVSTGRVEFFVADPAAMQRLVAAGTLSVPNYVTFGQAGDLSPQREANAEGGRPLGGGACTSGFVVRHTSTQTRYLLTAGHCANSLTYNGAALPWVGERWQTGASFDYQWHSAPGFTLTNTIYEGLANPLQILYIWPYANMYEGDYICKYGSATGFTCGDIVTKYYDLLGHSGFVQVHDYNNSDLSSGGDSGGPWYYDAYNEAWGIHTDNARENPNDAVFMPIDYISNSRLTTLTSQ
jgi:hypothetical protein